MRPPGSCCAASRGASWRGAARAPTSTTYGCWPPSAVSPSRRSTSCPTAASASSTLATHAVPPAPTGRPHDEAGDTAPGHGQHPGRQRSGPHAHLLRRGTGTDHARRPGAPAAVRRDVREPSAVLHDGGRRPAADRTRRPHRLRARHHPDPRAVPPGAAARPAAPLRGLCQRRPSAGRRRERPRVAGAGARAADRVRPARSGPRPHAAAGPPRVAAQGARRGRTVRLSGGRPGAAARLLGPGTRRLGRAAGLECLPAGAQGLRRAEPAHQERRRRRGGPPGRHGADLRGG